MIVYDKGSNKGTWAKRRRKNMLNKGKICSEDGCPNKARIKGLCKLCYNKKWHEENKLIKKGYSQDRSIQHKLEYLAVMNQLNKTKSECDD